MNSLFLPYDTFERHKRVGELLGKNKTVVDIGGQLNMLAKFSDAAKVVVANLESSQEKSDLRIKKGKLPFIDNSFDVACSIDVLEHIPEKERGEFINELLRISREKAILSFPLGTKEHIAYENEIEKWLKVRGHDVSYLKEHIKYGLPSQEEIEKITQGMSAKTFFSGDLKVNKFLFKLFMFDPKIPIVRRLIYFSKNIFYFLTNPILYAMLANKQSISTNKKYPKNAVRAYLVIEKKS